MSSNLSGPAFCYRIRAFPACCPPCHKGGACEGTGGSRPPLAVLEVYLCCEALLPGKPEMLGNGLSNGYYPPDMSELETDGLEGKKKVKQTGDTRPSCLSATRSWVMDSNPTWVELACTHTHSPKTCTSD